MYGKEDLDRFSWRKSNYAAAQGPVTSPTSALAEMEEWSRWLEESRKFVAAVKAAGIE